MGSGRWSLGLLFVILALLVSLAGAAAAWADDPAYVSSSQAKDANRHALTITAPTGAAMGDALIAQITYVGGSRETITVPLGWTRLYRTDNGTRVGQAVYWKIGGATDAGCVQLHVDVRQQYERLREHRALPVRRSGRSDRGIERRCLHLITLDVVDCRRHHVAHQRSGDRPVWRPGEVDVEQPALWLRGSLGAV